MIVVRSLLGCGECYLKLFFNTVISMLGSRRQPSFVTQSEDRADPRKQELLWLSKSSVIIGGSRKEQLVVTDCHNHRSVLACVRMSVNPCKRVSPERQA